VTQRAGIGSMSRRTCPRHGRGAGVTPARSGAFSSPRRLGGAPAEA
jgi:hypothetical protein